MLSTQRASIVVIGGGIAGVGCASFLASHSDVLVLESDSVAGYHSTSRSAAIFIPSYGNHVIQALTAQSQPYLDTPPSALATGSFLSPRGELLLSMEDEVERFEQLLIEAPHIRELSLDEALTRVPILNRQRFVRACIEENARDIDVDRLLQCWQRKLKSAGGVIETSRSVTALEQHNNGWRLQTTKGPVDAEIVVNAAGAWADTVAGMAGLDPLGLTACRRSAALLPVPQGYCVNDWPLFGSISENWYAKPMSGKLMVSPADEDPVEPHDAFADDMVLAEGLYRFEQAVTVPVTRVEHNWAGLRTFARDRVPVVGEDPRKAGFFWLAGQGGYGVQTAPALSRLAATVLLESLQGFKLSDIDEPDNGFDTAIDPELVRSLDPGRLIGLSH
ncbi:MAG: glycerol-3-phosphate dehydrogenase [marine bacterium B5-7]|nr:MAG: glycerol-3-phosphate dehydrogenase [marine bacterium B5-7]